MPNKAFDNPIRVRLFTLDGRQLSTTTTTGDTRITVTLPHNPGAMRTLLLRVRFPDGSEITHRLVQY